MEINFRDVMSLFFKIPPPVQLGWRSENDYIYEYIEYLRDRYGIVFPDHTILLIHGDLNTMQKTCRLLYTKGNEELSKFHGLKYKELNSVKNEYENEWGTT